MTLILRELWIPATELKSSLQSRGDKTTNCLPAMAYSLARLYYELIDGSRSSLRTHLVPIFEIVNSLHEVLSEDFQQFRGAAWPSILQINELYLESERQALEFHETFAKNDVLCEEQRTEWRGILKCMIDLRIVVGKVNEVS